MGVPTDPYYGGGGGGGGGGTPLPSTNAPKASAIFRNQNMIAENWNVLENMIEKIIEICMGGQLYNGLKKALNGKKLTIQFTSGSGSSFGFDGSTSGITLSTQMESNHLFHEMWHAYQAYQETAETYKNSLLNLEIEAHYAQYLYLKSLPEFANSKWEAGYQRVERLIAVKNIDRFFGNEEKVYDDSESFLDIYLQYSVGKIFKEEEAYKNCSFDESRFGFSNFKNLTQIIKDCLK